MFGHVPEDTYCDWWPSRWRALVVVGLFLHPSDYEPITEEQYAMADVFAESAREGEPT